MPRGRKKEPAPKPASRGAKRGRKHIFTPEQKRVLARLIRTALKEELRFVVKGL